jgi:hypothetical protein
VIKVPYAVRWNDDRVYSTSPKGLRVGTVVWEITDGRDRVWTREELEKEDELTFDLIWLWWIRSTYTRNWVLPADGAKWFRYSRTPNLRFEADKLIVAKDIPGVREMTVPAAWDGMRAWKKRIIGYPTLKRYLKHLRRFEGPGFSASKY